MLQKYFGTLPDVRQKNKIKHNLLEIVMMTIYAVMIGCEFWYQISEYCSYQIDWLRKKLGLKLENGVASHDTFQRIFATIDPKEFEKRFVFWVRAVCKVTKGEFVGIDGKTVRGSRSKEHSPLHLVSAWAHKNRLVLGQTLTDSKSNEITAIPDLLKLLDLNGCIITIDAMGTQKDIAKNIAQKNDYVLAVKGNQQALYKDIYTYFEETLQNKKLYFDQNSLKTSEKSHGRIEKREYYLSTDIDWLEQKNDWAGLKSIGAVWSETKRNGKVYTEHRYYITTLSDINSFAEAVRSHWGIENSLHWCLDAVFREDACKTRNKNVAENFATIRKIVLNILKNYPTEKTCSLNAKRLRCKLNFSFKIKVESRKLSAV